MIYYYLYRLSFENKLFNVQFQIYIILPADTVVYSNIRTIEGNADVLLNAYKDIGLAVNTGKTKYMGIGRHRE